MLLNLAFLLPNLLIDVIHFNLCLPDLIPHLLSVLLGLLSQQNEQLEGLSEFPLHLISLNENLSLCVTLITGLYKFQQLLLLNFKFLDHLLKLILLLTFLTRVHRRFYYVKLGGPDINRFLSHFMCLHPGLIGLSFIVVLHTHHTSVILDNTENSSSLNQQLQ